ncbi:MAG: DUF1580 domain-containing protein [Planctomycetes bacterium]|nr:DUF1580 domain-containing protein [Planctomycetota bacterium]
MIHVIPYSIDIERDRLVRIRDLPDHIAKRGVQKPHYASVRRWARRGVRGIVLPSIMLGGIRYTSIEAWSWWVSTTTAAAAVAQGVAGTVRKLSASERRTLERAGIIEPQAG